MAQKSCRFKGKTFASHDLDHCTGRWTASQNAAFASPLAVPRASKRARFRKHSCATSWSGRRWVPTRWSGPRAWPAGRKRARFPGLTSAGSGPPVIPHRRHAPRSHLHCVRAGSAVVHRRVRDCVLVPDSDSLGVALVHGLVGVAIRAGGARYLRQGVKRQDLRSRTEPSCATDATSVPSGLKMRPRVSPRPPCALGESCA
jgi:hypothetical protein